MSGLTETEMVLIIIEKDDKTELIALSLKNISAINYLKIYDGRGDTKIAVAKTSDKPELIISQLLA